jgi:Fe/S biogenesis protein NfuA
MDGIMSEEEAITLEDISEFINEFINPGLEVHSGYLEIVTYDKETKSLKIVMGGGCQGCASASATLKLMITNALMEEFPSLASIEDATNHSAGANPYY